MSGLTFMNTVPGRVAWMIREGFRMGLLCVIRTDPLCLLDFPAICLRKTGRVTDAAIMVAQMSTY